MLIFGNDSSNIYKAVISTNMKNCKEIDTRVYESPAILTHMIQGRALCNGSLGQAGYAGTNIVEGEELEIG